MGTATGTCGIVSARVRSETAGLKRCEPGRTSSAPCVGAVSTRLTWIDTVTDEHETSAGATSRWKLCALAPDEVYPAESNSEEFTKSFDITFVALRNHTG